MINLNIPNPAPPLEKFEDYGLETGSVVVHMAYSLYVLLPTLLLFSVIFVVSKMLSGVTKVKLFLVLSEKMKVALFWNLPLRFGVESFLEIFILASINLRTSYDGTIGRRSLVSSFSLISGYFGLVIIIGLMSITFFVGFKIIKRLPRSPPSSMSELITGINHKKKSPTVLFYLFFLGKRILVSVLIAMFEVIPSGVVISICLGLNVISIIVACLPKQQESVYK